MDDAGNETVSLSVTFSRCFYFNECLSHDESQFFSFFISVNVCVIMGHIFTLFRLQRTFLCP
jgi:hypothetical protein